MRQPWRPPAPPSPPEPIRSPVLTWLLEQRVELYPPGQTVLSITSIGEGAIIVTDLFVYLMRPDSRSQFTIERVGPSR